ncbi:MULTISPECIES: FAD-binding protein [unclassified Rhodococcus (in: high G+C Gram-positive bacteria)]|uniref:FAD-binding protein n=1 Tax=unclassified Rhodococcus (in: high G+C Gram-positive bacteria) TaxID=192944 RepID=UPI0007C7F205|nr:MULTISPECIES: FAD-binding protein [unclassified Rhodococcus (in: high G+C Gram-positive bacteria)]
MDSHHRNTRTTDLPPPALDGELRFDQVARAQAADDFGHIVHTAPEAVLLPGSTDDVAETIRWAAKRGRTFAAQGQRHSVWGRSGARNGIVADMSTLHSVGRVQGDRIVVGAGVTWREVLAATLPRGKTPPVLTDYLELSVGGTLVVGGVGGTTSRYGVQSDNVIAMDVVTGTGEAITCSAQSNSDLFDAVRAGLGQVGVITEATLELVAAPEQVRRFVLFYPNLTGMLTDARLLSADAGFDAVQGAILAAPTGGLSFQLDVATFFTGNPPDDELLLAGLSDDPARRNPSTIAYVDYLERLAGLEAALRANGQWFHPHPWITTFIGDSHVESVVDEELGSLDPAMDLGRFGQIVLSPIRTGAITSPLLRTPSEGLCFAFNFVRVPTTADLDDAHRLVESNRAVYERVRSAGGTLYPVSAFPMSNEDWRRHFGSAFHRLGEAEKKFDPDHVLTPGYDVFEGGPHDGVSRRRAAPG